MMQALVDMGDLEGQKNLSQQAIQNAWYHAMFGFHSIYGVHGSCPLEVLHWILIGSYQYVRGMLFGQTGDKFILTGKINAMASMMRYLFQQLSDHEFPQTRFSKGIIKGKLMGHEMTGLMLVLLATLRSTKGGETRLHGGKEYRKSSLGGRY
jgi:hypothetical protein